MKKILFFAAVATALVCSCQKQSANQDQSENGQTPVAFSNYVVKSKSTSISLDSVKTNGFGVFAFEQEQASLKDYSKANFVPNFMYNQKVAFDGTDWTYSPIKYWPNNPGAKVSFFAYAPYIAKFNADENTITPETNSYLQKVVPTDPECLRLVLGYDHFGPGIEYTVPSDARKGVDLMWGAWMISGVAQPTCPCDIEKPALGDKVVFQLKHALSRLAFDLQVWADAVAPGGINNPLAAGTSVNIKSVSLKGNFASKGTLRLYDGTWNVANTDYKNIDFVEGAGQFSDLVEASIETDEAIERVALLQGIDSGADKNNYLMLIPGAEFYIEIVYDVITTDNDNPKNSSTVTNTIRSYDANAKCSTSTDGYFKIEPGYAYTFHLTIGLNSVKFEADVKPWTELAEEEVDLPKNE